MKKKTSRRNRKKVRCKYRKRPKSNNERLYGTNNSKNVRSRNGKQNRLLKNERTEGDNYRNGYYLERTVNKDYAQINVRVPRDRNNEIESDLFPKYARNINEFEEKVINRKEI